MKKCLTLLAATVLSGMMFTFSAAQPYASPATGQLQASGTISATGASNLSDLEDKLVEKAKEQGAKGLVVDSAGGKNQMYGTATIYKQPPPSQPSYIHPGCSFLYAVYFIATQFVINVLAF